MKEDSELQDEDDLTLDQCRGEVVSALVGHNAQGAFKCGHLILVLFALAWQCHGWCIQPP